jgi:hypothetical protein
MARWAFSELYVVLTDPLTPVIRLAFLNQQWSLHPTSSPPATITSAAVDRMAAGDTRDGGRNHKSWAV